MAKSWGEVMKTNKDHGSLLIKTGIYLTLMIMVTHVNILAYQKVRSFLEDVLHLPAPSLQMGRSEANAMESKVKSQPVLIYHVESKTIRHTSAYNAGDPKQTDSDPCISSDGSNICKELAQGEKICAANFVPLGTRLYIEGFGICTVKDRMNSRYKNKVDLAMSKRKKKEAKEWGVKATEVHVLK
jgi:3D (Asp-Asp-Asp) domain-containing protein